MNSYKKLELKNNGASTVFDISLKLVNSSENIKKLYTSSKEILIASINDIDALFFKQFLYYYDDPKINYDDENKVLEITELFLSKQNKYVIDLLLFTEKYKFTNICNTVKNRLTTILTSGNIDDIRVTFSASDDLTEIEKEIIDDHNKQYDSNNFNNINNLLYLASLNNSLDTSSSINTSNSSENNNSSTNDYSSINNTVSNNSFINNSN